MLSIPIMKMHYNGKEIAILLATYNGAWYLCQQIDSIYSQTEQGFTLYFHDDGSTDSSMEIIKQYVHKYNNIIIMEDLTKNRGAKGSFIWMLENVDSKYYMFCDQDDIWIPNKVEITLKAIKEAEHINTKIPIVVITDLIVVDQNLKIKHPSMWKESKINTKLLSQFKYLSVYNIATGCTMMINESAKQVVLPISQKVIMHDSWIAIKVVSSGGRLICINTPTVLYRQHTNNVVGMQKVDASYFLRKLYLMRKVIADNKSQIKMINEISKTSIFIYLWRKFLYYILR